MSNILLFDPVCFKRTNDMKLSNLRFIHTNWGSIEYHHKDVLCLISLNN